ncbi:MAG: nucleotide exchange factor GrpE [Gammaproteobacteria bacterium]|jgi:molecular chaperone GrpE|nr:nucleotide exchange factor GrpE [Gammaproteobacteria bacterium]
MTTEATPPDAPEGAETPQSELETLRAALAAAEAQVAQHRDQQLRALAELENVRKRAQRDVESAHRFSLEKLVQELIPVKDSLDLAVENAAKADAAALVEGQAATSRLFDKAFERIGITVIDPVGQPFDANQHEAMMAQPSSTAEPNSVLMVVQRGYALNGRLVRPARVIVAKAPDPA